MIQKTKEGILKHQRQKSQDYLQKWDRYREKRYIEQDKYINFIKQSAKYRTIITWLKIRQYLLKLLENIKLLRIRNRKWFVKMCFGIKIKQRFYRRGYCRRIGETFDIRY